VRCEEAHATLHVHGREYRLYGAAVIEILFHVDKLAIIYGALQFLKPRVSLGQREKCVVQR
jgi:hypothetical protein